MVLMASEVKGFAMGAPCLPDWFYGGVGAVFTCFLVLLPIDGGFGVFFSSSMAAA